MKINHAWCTDNAGAPLSDNEVKKYIAVRPSERHLKFNEMKYYNFICIYLCFIFSKLFFRYIILLLI